jgi:L-ribulokinase
MKTYALGLDFGTESGRAVLVDVENGNIAATAVHVYADGVIDTKLPSSGKKLPPDWALQNPADWLAVLETTIPAVLAESGITADAVIGIGLDFTASTVLPVSQDGTPLCQIDAYKKLPHAWPKLWKHHAAQPQADRINQLAIAENEAFLPRYGGIVSSEWLLPKALQLLEEAPALYSKTALIIEASDWIAWQLSGRLTRSACAAGYKGTWHKQAGFPSQDFLIQLNPDLADLFNQKDSGDIVVPGAKIGGLTREWAARLGLNAGTPLSAPIIDAHAAAIGGGLTKPGTMFLIMGTSTCHMLMSEKEVLVEGISGVVEDGIVPGFYGYEAGQAGVGDIFAWFVENNVPAEYATEAQQRAVTPHDILTEKAQRLRPGESGLLALDWWNGCRTPLVDAELSGLLMGYSLQTKPEEIYRALIEATALGTRLIIELFQEGGVSVEKLCAGGGLTKNKMLQQIYADVIGLTL